MAEELQIYYLHCTLEDLKTGKNLQVFLEQREEKAFLEQRFYSINFILINIQYNNIVLTEDVYVNKLFL